MLVEPPRPNTPPSPIPFSGLTIPASLALPQNLCSTILAEHQARSHAEALPVETSRLAQHLEALATQVEAGAHEGPLILLRFIIFDGLLFTLMPPLAQAGQLPSITLHDFEALLARILEAKTVLAQGVGLAHLEEHPYREYTLSQRELLLSTACLPESTRTAFIHSNAFHTLLRHPNLDTWLRESTSGHCMQTFLNTCTASVFAQDVLAHAPTIASLTPITWQLHSTLETKLHEAPEAYTQSLVWKEGPTVAKLVHERLKTAASKLYAWERTIEEALSSEEPPASFSELTQSWAQIMEVLLSCAQVLSQPTVRSTQHFPLTVNTPLYIRGHWNLSARLLSFKDFLRRCAFLNTKGPRLKERYEHGYVDYVGTQILLAEAVRVSAPEDASTSPRELKPHEYLEEKDLHAIWQQIAIAGGTRLERPGHAAFMEATILHGTPHFRLQDPMEGSARSLSFAALRKLFKPHAVVLFLEKA